LTKQITLFDSVGFAIEDFSGAAVCGATRSRRTRIYLIPLDLLGRHRKIRVTFFGMLQRAK